MRQNGRSCTRKCSCQRLFDSSGNSEASKEERPRAERAPGRQMLRNFLDSAKALVLREQWFFPVAPASPSASSSVSKSIATALHSAFAHLVDSLPLLSVFLLFQVSCLLALTILAVNRIRLVDQSRRLKEASSAIAHGDRNARASLSTGPLDDLGQTFDDMVTILTNEIRDLRATQRELEQLVATDRLTGVANRRQFELQAETECARAKRYGLPTSLILFDVDNFRPLNARYGHQVGDAVLVQLVHRVASRLRDTDLMARWGGEEFAILTPCTPACGAEILAEKIRRVVAEEDFDVVGRVTLSFGVTQLDREQTVTQWIAAADEQLYDAKRTGCNRVCPSQHTAPMAEPFLLVWSDHFLVHHAAIDAAHRELFRLANAVLFHLRDDDKPANLARVDAVLNHVTLHFQSEETILAELGCTTGNLANHRQMHQSLLAQAAALRAGFVAGTIEISDVSDFIVRRMAVGHLLHEDQKLLATLTASQTMPLNDSAPPTVREGSRRTLRMRGPRTISK
jgi:diguanylate cyclase (GGDEF)-like protein/hemerythrin-like metal-binding protein